MALSRFPLALVFFPASSDIYSPKNHGWDHMQIVLHAGAHFTEEERLFKTLLRNKSEFAQRGVAIPGPSKYRPLLRETMTALHEAPPAPDARAVLLDAILDEADADRVILSHVHIFGAPRACFRDGRFYDLAPQRIAQLSQLFGQDTLEIFIALRDPAAFLPALFAASPQEDMESFLRGHSPYDIKWSDTLQEIRATAPEVQVTAWCFEDMPMIWAEIIREMGGLEHGEKIVGGFDLLSQIMSREGMQRFRAYLKSHADMSERQKRRVISAFLDKFAIEDEIEEEVEAPGWTDHTIEALSEIYEDDINACARIPGVNFISP